MDNKAGSVVDHHSLHKNTCAESPSARWSQAGSNCGLAAQRTESSDAPASWQQTERPQRDRAEASGEETFPQSHMNYHIL